MSTQTVFVPFRYCPLCRFNHNKGKKHVFSQKHKDIVAKILVKFLKKITEANTFLKKPSIRDTTWDQAGKKFWCYFCQMDIDKHRLSVTLFGQCVVEYGGFLEHITRNDHTENTAKFLKENILDMKRTSEFIINSKVYLKYLEDVESAAAQFFAHKSQVLNQVASQIRSQSETRHAVVVNTLREQTLQQQSLHHQWQQTNTLRPETRGPKPLKGRPAGSEEKGKKTVQAFGEGLTTIERLDEDDSSGNIYTDAVPPWMQPDQDRTPSTCVIGPTVDDLEKHRKLERKRQLPACRVGAKFDHKSGTTESWLPDFGGVWNHGRRTKSVHQFVKRQKRGGSLHSSSPSFVGGSHQELTAMPQSSYSFPKIPRRTATVTSNSLLPTNSNHGQDTDKMNSGIADLGGVFPISVANVQQNVNFCYQPDTNMSALTSCTSSRGARGLTDTASHQVSDLVDAGDSVTVKPYVRRNRLASSAGSEQNQATLPVYLPQIPVYCPAQFSTLNTRNNAPEAHTHSSLNSEMSFKNNSLLSGHGQHWYNNSTAYERPKQDGQSSVCVGKQDLKTGSFRLLATPVLSQQRSKLPSKHVIGPGRRDK